MKKIKKQIKTEKQKTKETYKIVIKYINQLIVLINYKFLLTE